MPDRDYYLSNDAKLADARAKYVPHVAKMLVLSGVPEAQAATAARRTSSRSKPSLPRSTGPASRAATTTRPTTSGAAPTSPPAPGFDWNAYLSAAGLGEQNEFIVSPAERLCRHGQGVCRDAAADRSRTGRCCTPRATPPACCPRPSPKSASTSPAARFRARPRWSRAGSGASMRSTAPSAKRWASFTSPATSRRRPRPRWTSWSATSSRPWTRGSPTCRG
jgi:hypothetical protein